jgi:transcriptional regulator of arginine metabolism
MKGDAKQQRQRAIRELVRRGDMHTQEELVDALRREGIQITQATISRDIVELGLVRAAVGGKVIYTLPETVALSDTSVSRRRLASLLGEVPAVCGDAHAMLVVRTSPGMANLLAIIIDACAFPEIVGTVAGDDTILIAMREEADRERVRGYLMETARAAE